MLFIMMTAMGSPGHAASDASHPRLMAFGDSLTAGFGLPPADSFPSQLEQALKAENQLVEVLNAGVSGDTTSGGLARLDWALSDNPDLIIVALGANDSLRGVDPAITRANLSAILEKLQNRQIPVLLAGIYAPPNLGRQYGKSFNSIYPDLAERYDIPLYPFFLDGVVSDPSLNQQDGIHPNQEGVAVIVGRILPHVMRLIEEWKRTRSAG
ncbi:MAG: arylesterase [Gammaproteobacteria bacterium]|nr:arylesterase [Gammaproteobacteria bacterium]